MLRTYLKFAIRTFWRDKFYTLLNIFGLAIGLAVSIIILLYLQNDLTYDQHHARHEQVYRLATNIKGPGVEWHMGSSAREVAPLLAEHYPEIESFVRLEPIEHQCAIVRTGQWGCFADCLHYDEPSFAENRPAQPGG